ncbi:MAG TPA: tRNA pseudouridine(55) synthase TruB [Phycisphaerales bacterium]|nr:tRNA pseudouridine(55) synthase TruB [Phycisphaerales bacterium]
MNDAPGQSGQRQTPCGVLVIDKPLGPTSMDICRRVRWRLVQGGAPKRVKVGHGGTLDPLATGVLVVMVGKATKLCETVMAGTKVYAAGIDLSCFSTTDDQEGEKTVVDVQAPPTRGAVEVACARFVGAAVPQTPPAFSAMKIGGQRAYDMARRGEEVKLAARPVRIDRVDVKQYAWPLLTVEVECGKGTYIRSLARDIGVALGTGGCLTSLRRTRVGQWGIEQAVQLGALRDSMDQADLLPVHSTAGGEHVH